MLQKWLVASALLNLKECTVVICEMREHLQRVALANKSIEIGQQFRVTLRYGLPKFLDVFRVLFRSFFAERLFHLRVKNLDVLRRSSRGSLFPTSLLGFSFHRQSRSLLYLRFVQANLHKIVLRVKRCAQPSSDSAIAVVNGGR